MENILLIDFGSTYTKVTAVDLTHHKLLGNASAYTTVATDVRDGLASALDELKLRTGLADFSKRLACSSAAGGLRMVACGLVPDLTAKAASLASLGAGAKVIGLYSYQLTEDDIEDIAIKSPDILLLTGGTDGGNTKYILENAAKLAEGPGEFPIIVAGNRSCGRQVKRILENRNVYLCENVMPSLGVINIEPTRQLIREIFLERIVKAKGLSAEAGLIDGILMPTPAAVMSAVELLANGCDGEPGIGNLIAVDVGGATTDVYSVAAGTPSGVNTIYKGLPEPYAKRTVEGDIGMRYSAPGVVDAAGIARISEVSGLSEEFVLEGVARLATETDSLPQTPEQKALDFALAALSIETATLRHAGTIEEVFTTSGRAFVQTGKDLTDVSRIVMTGGALLYADKHWELASYAKQSDLFPFSLRPKKADLLVDKHYILAAMGLLSGIAPLPALRILKEGCELWS